MSARELDVFLIFGFYDQIVIGFIVGAGKAIESNIDYMSCCYFLCRLSFEKLLRDLHRALMDFDSMAGIAHLEAKEKKSSPDSGKDT